VFTRARSLRIVAAALVATVAVAVANAPAQGTTTARPADRRAAFPVTVRADQGEVTIDAKPRRIVSLSASLTEMLYAIGAGKQVVAVDRFSNYPVGTPMTELSGLRPNLEGIARHEPDLVVLANDRDDVARSLGLLGIPTLVLSSAGELADVYREMKTLGAATGHATRAATVVRGIRVELDEIAASVPERARKMRYYYELSSAQHSPTSHTFIGELLGLLRLRSIADDATGDFPQLSNEYVVDANPDLIFLAHTDGTPQDTAAVAARPGWSQLRAVRNGRVVALDPNVAARWGPRIVELLRAVARTVRDVRTG
jgi:iron complex transport system substrate-binding protein